MTTDERSREEAMNHGATAREAELNGALGRVRERLARAADAAGRSRDQIQLLPITKFFPATDVIILSRLGCDAIGESREQEAAAKSAECNSTELASPIRWHMVGRIQRNKARSIANWAHTAHSVDSAKLITALDAASARALAEGARSEPLRVYVQISIDGDTARGGVDISAPDLVDEICGLAHSAQGLQFVGLMGIPPLGSDADDAFARLAAEHQRVQRSYPEPLGLSAGMSSDLESAVKHGSTCVRVGTALMGQRPLTSP